MNDTQSDLRDVVKDLFAGDKIDLVIGHEKGTLPLRSRPCFVSAADQADKLVWNSFCSNNLAVYLPRFFQPKVHQKGEETPPPRIGVVAKGCDVRSIIGLAKENQIPRENVVIVGVPCHGLIDPAKVEAALDGDGPSAYEEDSQGRLHVTTRPGAEKTIARDQVIADACIECRHPAPEGADVVVEGKSRQIGEEKYATVDEFESKSLQERWDYFVGEISKCIRCHACRQACPNCYCKVCFADQTKPRWMGAGDDLSDVMLYHIGRIFHQAGRCVECDACVRACPMGIDLRLFTRKLSKDVKELFDYVPGLSAEDLPPLCTFKEDDSQSFITEP